MSMWKTILEEMFSDDVQNSKHKYIFFAYNGYGYLGIQSMEWACL